MALGASIFKKPGSSAALLLQNEALVVTLGAKDNEKRPIIVRQINDHEASSTFFSSSIPVTAPVAGGLVFTKIVSLPPMPIEEVAPTILLTQKESLPFPADNAYIDTVILNGEEKDSPQHGLKALLVAIPKTEVDRLQTEYKKFGLRLTAVIPYVVAISSILKSEGINGKVVVINTEPERTGIIIFRNTIPLFIRDIPIGAASQDDEFSSSKTSSTAIAQEIDRSIKSFSSGSSGGSIEEGLLTGLSPILSEIGEEAKKVSGISFRHLAPSDLLSFDDHTEIDSGFSPTGLAPLFGAAIDSGSTINLLPSGAQKLKNFARSHIPLARVAAAIIFLAVSVSVFGAFTSDLDARIENLEAEVSFLENEKAQYDLAQSRLFLLSEENKRLAAILRRYPSASVSGYEWRRLFAEIAKSVPHNVKLTALVSTFERMAIDDSNGSYLTKLSGHIRGSDHDKVVALEEILVGLNRSTLFSSISLVAGEKKIATDGETEFFEFTIRAKTPPGASSLANRNITKKSEG